MSGDNQPRRFRVAVLSVVKHSYVARGILSHARFSPTVVADDANQPEWVHERNAKFAAEINVPYIRDVERAIADYAADIAIVSPETERHCDLSVRAANAGLHIVQDKPMSTRLSECDRLVDAVVGNQVTFLMWNRNCFPAILAARAAIQEGKIGRPGAIHVDFYFAKDAGPPIGSREPGAALLDWLEALKAAHATGADGGIGRDPMGELEVEGIYPLAYIQMLIGHDVKRVFARTTAHFHQLYADNGVDDLATLSLEMEDGGIGSICLGRIGRSSHPNGGEIKLHIVGSRGALVINESRPEVAVYYRGQPSNECRQIRVANDYDWLLAENFAQAIDNGTETILGVRSSRAIHATVVAAIESSKTGQPVVVSKPGSSHRAIVK
jgi:predicted dehydrogenase